MQKTKKGFTLIELLVVIAIIGILSAIGLVSLNGAREKARDAQRKSDIAQMNTALTLFYDDNNSQYPAQLNGAAGTKADCVDAAGDDQDATYATPPVLTAQAGAGNLWMSGAAVASKMIPTYVSRQLKPPAGGTGWANLYCYDTNEAAATGTLRDSYQLFGGLEGAGGTKFFHVKADGTSGDTLPAVCTTTDNC